MVSVLCGEKDRARRGDLVDDASGGSDVVSQPDRMGARLSVGGAELAGVGAENVCCGKRRILMRRIFELFCDSAKKTGGGGGGGS